MTTDSAGGFFPPSLLSPPTSVASTLTATVDLPKPRKHTLKAGSGKESEFINYVDRGILQVTRRYAKKFSTLYADQDANTETDGVNGYGSFSEVALDLEKLIDVVWVSATPSLQTPYLLNISLLLVSYLPSFPFAPKSTFKLLHKLDYAFVSLLQGRDIDTGEVMPGFDTFGARGLSQTEKVRMKSIVERTRVGVVELYRNGKIEESDAVEDDTELETENEGLGDEDVEIVERWDMEVARVYDRTIVELGDTLVSTNEDSKT